MSILYYNIAIFLNISNTNKANVNKINFQRLDIGQNWAVMAKKAKIIVTQDLDTQYIEFVCFQRS